MQHDLVFDKLVAWGHWSRADDDRLDWPGECGSAERHYRPAAGDLFVDPDLLARVPLISDDAGLRIERAVVSLGMPYTRLMALVFVRLVPLSVAARQLGIVNPRSVFDDALLRIAERLAGLPDQRRSGDRGAGATLARPAAQRAA